MEVQVEGLDRLERALKRIPDRFRNIIEELTNIIYRKAAEYAPERTGFLRRSISMHVEPLRGEVRAGAPYAGFVEFGTRPHMIFPRRARVLRFEIGGRTIFAAYVRHPGFKGRFYMRRALEDGLRRLGEVVERVFRML